MRNSVGRTIGWIAFGPGHHARVMEPADGRAIVCTATVETTGPTGVEMEALTAVQVALLTIYDMCKAADRAMVMTGVRLLQKHGGKSGSYVADGA